MNQLSLGEISAMSGGVLHGSDCMVDSVVTDTRHLQGGELFVALRGERFDGHDFVASGNDRGAAAALVERRVEVPLPQILVKDTLVALADLAVSWRERCRAVRIALTGSNGKTTTRTMLVSILKRRFKVISTRGNLNNHIGVPLTLLALRREHDVAVIELGANHPGEIAHLGRLVKPGIAVVLNAGAAHLEGFGDVNGVARAKGELFECLQAGSVGIVNANDAYCDYWRGLLKRCRVFSFGFGDDVDADIVGKDTPDGMEMRIEGRVYRLRPGLPGKHNFCNALAAAAAAHSLGVAGDEIVAGLEAAPSVSGRLRPLDGLCRVRLIDDSYNANPDSFRAALGVLGEFRGERWLAMGDMAELGDTAQQLHSEIGLLARRQGVRRLFACGDLSRAAVESFGEGGEHFVSSAALSGHLSKQVSESGSAGVMILVKGSRSAGMEKVVQALRRPTSGGTKGC